MSIRNRIREVFEASFTDTVFGADEKREIRQLLSGDPPDEKEKDLIRYDLFRIAGEKVDVAPVETLEWLRQASQVLEEGLRFPPANVWFSPGEECLHAIRNMVNTARQQLDICVFTISDDRISREIIEAADRGIRVRVITDNEKLYDKGSDIERIAASGIPVRIDRTSNHMHHKFAVADGIRALTGSYNWTRSAAQRNHENILEFTAPDIVSHFSQEFQRLWKEMEPLS